MESFFLLVSPRGTILADAATADEAIARRHEYRDTHNIAATVYHCIRVVGEPVADIAAALTEVVVPGNQELAA